MDKIPKEAKSYRIDEQTALEKSIPQTFTACELCRTRQGSVYLYGEVDGWFPDSTIEYEGVVPDLVINVPLSHHMLHSHRFANLDQRSNFVLIRFSGDRLMFDEILVQVKTLEGRKWDGKKKCWVVPATTENIEELMDWNFHLDRRAWKVYLDMTVAGADRYSLEEIDADIPCLFAGVECDGEYCPGRGVEGMCPL